MSDQAWQFGHAVLDAGVSSKKIWTAIPSCLANSKE